MSNIVLGGNVSFPSQITIGNTAANSVINATSFTGTSNNTLYVANVASNTLVNMVFAMSGNTAGLTTHAELSANLANYTNTAGLSLYTGTLTCGFLNVAGTGSNTYLTLTSNSGQIGINFYDSATSSNYWQIGKGVDNSFFLWDSIGVTQRITAYANGSMFFNVSSIFQAPMIVNGGVLANTAGTSITPFQVNDWDLNGDALQQILFRTANGAGWDTAAWRLQRKVDATFMGYVEFNNQGSKPLAFGLANTEFAHFDQNGSFITNGNTVVTGTLVASGLSSLNGGVWVGPASGKASLSLNSAGDQSIIHLYDSGNEKWQIGNNPGSDQFFILNNAHSFNALTIDNATNNIALGGSISATGNSSFSNVSISGSLSVSGAITGLSYPVANSTTQGVVQIGANITVTSGTISLTSGNITSALGYTPAYKPTSVSFSSAGSLTAAQSGSLVELSGGTTYTVNLPSPAAGLQYFIYNASSTVAYTLSTPSGSLNGPNGSGSATQSLTSLWGYGVWCDGTNWIVEAVPNYTAANAAALNASNITSGTIGASYLPAATAAAFGAVKVGSNITVSSGTISIASGNVTSALGYTPFSNAGGTISGSLTTTGDINSGGRVYGGTGYQCRTGAGGGFGGNEFNIYWNGSYAYLYIDSSNIGTFSYVSDPRLKKNFEPATSGLDIIKSLEPVTFNWRDIGIWKDDGLRHYGFNAKQVHSVFPTAVHGEPDAVDENGEIVPQNLDPIALIAALTSTVKELVARIEILEAQK